MNQMHDASTHDAMSVQRPGAIPETSALDTQGADLIRQAEAIQVVDQPSLEQAAGFARLVKAYLAEVEAFMAPIVTAAWVAHKTAVAKRDGLKVHATRAEAILKERMGAYHREQERLRREAEARARQEREEAERQERERVAAENARRLREEEERRLEEAAQAEARGDRAAAERIIAQPVTIPTAVVPRPVFTAPADIPAPAKVAGVSFGEDWVFEMVDAGAVPREYLKLDEVAIGKVVRAMKGRTAIPGIRAYAQPRTAIRA